MDHCVCVVVFLMLVAVWLPGHDAQTCTVSDIQAVQPNINFMTEKLDGHWYVSKVYRDATTNPLVSFYSHTADVVPTQSGFTLYAGSNTSTNTECEYVAIELNATSDKFRFSTEGTPAASAEPRTVLVAAANSDIQYALLYICYNHASADQTCTTPMALLVGRQPNPQAASSWLSSLTSSLPCFNTTAGSVVQQGAECPLRPMWKLTGRNCAVSSFPVQQNFNLTKYVSGVWREMSWLAPAYLDPNEFYRDYVHNYRIQPNGTLTCSVAGRDPKDDKCFFYELSLSTTNVPGKLILYDQIGPVPYNVIYVDYEHYSIVFGCYNQTAAGECRMARGWLWSRDVTLDRQYRLAANSLLQNLCVNPAAFLPTEQKKECVKDTGGSSSLRSAGVLILCMLLFVVSLTG